jgi:cobalt/nickel transport system permease protein
VPLLGLAAAFIFAAQMLNFPVAAGTSGHLIGGVLAAVLLGPAAAVVVISAVLVLQCFAFTDGGVTALGANIFNMALVAPVAGWWIYRAAGGLTKRHDTISLAAVAFAAWCSTVLAAMCCAGQLAMSGTIAWRAAFPAMTGVHALIGIGEAFITVLILSAVRRARPELLDATTQPHLQPRLFEFAGFGLFITLGMVVFIAPFACPWPDGLEKIAARLGFEHRAADASLLASPFADYSIPGIASKSFSTIVAGLAGTLAVFLLVWSLARAVKTKCQKPEVKS